MPAANISRRRFLRACCLTGAALAASAACTSLLPITAFSAPGSSRGSSPFGEPRQETQLLMGTIVTISALCPASVLVEEAFGRAFEEMRRLIAVFDRFNAATALGVLNSQGSLSDIPQELHSVLTQAETLARLTDDAFNPAVAPLVDLYRNRPKGAPLPDKQAVNEALALAQPGALRLSKTSARLDRSGMRLTLDGIAKGYIADKASETLSAHGITHHLVNAGGDIRASGLSAPGSPWTIGIENSLITGGMETVSLSSGAIATSGSSQNFYDPAHKHHHLISHRTGQSPDVLSVTVKAPTTAQADSLATALALLPPAEALRFVQTKTTAQCLILTSQARYASNGWG